MVDTRTPIQDPSGFFDALPRWRVQLLGDVRLRSAQGRVIERLPSRAVALLLARLAMAPQRAHPREELVDMLWPDAGLDVGRNRLRQVLSTLKSLLEAPGLVGSEGAVIVADRQSLRAAPGALGCDVLDFEACVRARDRAAAFALYRGPLMPGYFDEWVLDERQRLEGLAERMDFESLAAQAPTLQAPPEPAMPDAVRATTLPSYLTPLHGADETLLRLQSAVATHRLITVMGPGGSGKTRLAVEAAWRLTRDAEPIGAAAARWSSVTFVSLVTASTAEAALDAIGGSFQIGASSELEARRTALQRALRGRRALMVLDNCEQIAEPLAAELAILLDRVPELHVVATSRRALGLDGELVFSLLPLRTPAQRDGLALVAESPAVALFVDRARVARADFHLSERNAVAVADLVRWLDGMPLAIEIAAARVRTLGPAAMLSLLQQEDHAGLAFMARSGPRGGRDTRHASMVEVVAWSWRLLSDAARDLLADLSVFTGSFTLEAAQAVAGASLAHTVVWLDELIEHSMLRPATDGERYAPYELIREFAASQLTPSRALQARARQRAWLQAWAMALPATPPLVAVRAEMPNIVAVLGTAVRDKQPESALDVLRHLRRCFDDVELPPGGLQHLQEAIAHSADPQAAARGHAQIAPLLFHAGQAQAALRSAQLAIEMLDRLGDSAPDPVLRARALHALASVRWRATRKGSDSLQLIDEAEPLAQAAGALDVQASLCALRAFITNQHLRDAAQAEALHTRAVDLWRMLGNQHAVNSGLYNLAVVASHDGRAELALARIEPVLSSARHLDDGRRIRQALNIQGLALTSLRRWRAAGETLRECIRQSWLDMAVHDLVYGLWNLPRVMAHQRQPEAALRLAAFAAQYWRDHFGLMSPQDHREIRLVRRLAQLGLAPARVDALWREGETMALGQAVALALHDAPD